MVVRERKIPLTVVAKEEKTTYKKREG